MRKRIANVLGLLCAVVCVTSALWVVRSCFSSDQAGVSIGQGRLWLATIDAQLIVAWDPSAVLPPSFDSVDAAGLRPALDTVWSGLRGIRALGIGWNLTGLQDERLILPLWLLPLLTAIPSVRWWHARRRASGAGFDVLAPSPPTRTPRTERAPHLVIVSPPHPLIPNA